MFKKRTTKLDETRLNFIFFSPFLTFLPDSNNDVVSNYFGKKEKKYGLLAAFNAAKESIMPSRTKKGY